MAGVGDDGWVDVDQNLQHSAEVAGKLTSFFRPRSIANVQGGADYHRIDHPLLHQFYNQR